MSTWSIFPTSSYNSTTSTCPLKVVKTWVAIKLVDENDKPIPRAKYIIILPDGTRKEDYLDDNGYAYFDELTPGVCDVAFPELDPFHSFHNSLTTSKRIEDLRTGVSGTVGMTA